ncbi:MAG: hypothetical protein M3N68_01180 [Actinomycetota bacterium]|nr:hypothetical protein [Actinomycetota bacterium]
MDAAQRRGYKTRQTYANEDTTNFALDAQGKLGLEFGVSTSVRSASQTSTGAEYWDGAQWVQRAAPPAGFVETAGEGFTIFSPPALAAERRTSSNDEPMLVLRDQRARHPGGSGPRRHAPRRRPRAVAGAGEDGADGQEIGGRHP